MGDQLKSLNTRVPETQKKALDEFCQAHNISRQDVVTQAIDAFFSSTADKYPTYAGDIELVKECTETIFEKYVNAIHSLETARTLGSAEQRKAVDVLSTSNDELRQQLSAARTETESRSGSFREGGSALRRPERRLSAAGGRGERGAARNGPALCHLCG